MFLIRRRRKHPTWLRWKVATFIDRHFRWQCWADLATWASFEDPWRELPKPVRESCFTGPGTCYCGKYNRWGGGGE